MAVVILAVSHYEHWVFNSCARPESLRESHDCPGTDFLIPGPISPHPGDPFILSIFIQSTPNVDPPLKVSVSLALPSSQGYVAVPGHVLVVTFKGGYSQHLV